MIILGIDPGEKVNGYVVFDFDEKCVLERGETNTERIKEVANNYSNVAMETWTVGNPKIKRTPLFQTIENIGMLKEHFLYRMTRRIYPTRAEVLRFMRIKGDNHDSQVMHWIKAMFPGIGLSGHAWQAMGVAVYAYYQWGGR
jgi:hypothetical protein